MLTMNVPSQTTFHSTIVYTVYIVALAINVSVYPADQEAITYYRKTSSISHTKSKNLNISDLVLQLSLLVPLKSGVKSSMKM